VSEVATRSRRVSLERGDNPLLYAQKLFVRFLQGLFNFNAEGKFHWEPDAERTEVIIRAEAPLDMKTVGKKPAVTVVMGPVQYQGLGIDQLMYMNLTTGRRVHADLISGHFVVYCLAENDVVAQWLAHLVVHGTYANRRLLEGSGGFHQIARPAASQNSPSPPGALIHGDPTGLFMVQVNLPFSFQWTWAEEPTAPASARSIDMINQERRASDYLYSSPSVLEKVQLAMSSAPVVVRRIGSPPETLREAEVLLETVFTSNSSDEA